MFNNALRIGAVRGVAIRVDASWAVVALLFGLGFWTQFSRAEGYAHGALTAAIMAAVAVVLFFVSILVHELAHALEAQRRGVRVAGITLFLFGGVTETRLELDRPRDEFAITAIGPFVSFVAAAALGLVAMTCLLLVRRGQVAYQPLADVTGVLAWLNAALGAFNLLPGAPLDGGRMLRSAVWSATGDRARSMRVAANAGRVLGGGIMVAGLLFVVLGGAWVAGLFDAAIGWFLWRAAASELRRALALERLQHRPVRDAMTGADEAVPLDADLVDVVAALRGPRRVLPVASGGRIVGTVHRDDLEREAGAVAATAGVADVMRPAGALPTVASDRSVAEILPDLREGGAVAVVRDGDLVGIVTQASVADTWLGHGSEGSGDAARPAPHLPEGRP